MEGSGSRSFEEIRGDLEPLIAHVSSGKGLGFGPFRPKEVKNAQYIVDEIRVGGRRCADLETMRQLQQWLAVQSDLGKIHELWQPYTEVRSEVLRRSF